MVGRILSPQNASRDEHLKLLADASNEKASVKTQDRSPVKSMPQDNWEIKLGEWLKPIVQKTRF